MAVYTKIDEQALSEFLGGYDLGELVSFEGIKQGVSNTNYHIFTTKDRYILTIFEEDNTKKEDLPFFFAYAKHMADNGIACPQAFSDKGGEIIGEIVGKPAAIIKFLEGKSVLGNQITADHCGQVGGFMAKMHVAAMEFPLERANEWGVKRWRSEADSLRSGMETCCPGLERAVYDELDYLEPRWPHDLPKGVIHADLFPDNVFFKDGKISAMIDMYFASTEILIFDLSIVINAWCFDDKHRLVPERLAELLKGYNAVRPLQENELHALQIVCRGEALFLLFCRLWRRSSGKGALTAMPDPKECVTILQFHQNKNILDSA